MVKDNHQVYFSDFDFFHVDPIFETIKNCNWIHRVKGIKLQRLARLSKITGLRKFSNTNMNMSESDHTYIQIHTYLVIHIYDIKFFSICLIIIHSHVANTQNRILRIRFDFFLFKLQN